MDLIDKIRSVLSGVLLSPNFDIHYDTQNNVIGYVADGSFENMDDKQSQELIWNTLKKYLGQDELIKILNIYNETPRERSERLIGSTKHIKHSNFWYHRTPDLSTFWSFIGVFKVEQNYKSFYLIINDKTRFKNGVSFLYPKEVIEFMDLEGGELYEEIYSNTFMNMENEIKYQLILQHEKLTEKGLWGKENMFNYIFENFELKPVSKNQLLFDETQVEIISKSLDMIEECEVKHDILQALENSKRLNSTKKALL